MAIYFPVEEIACWPLNVEAQKCIIKLTGHFGYGICACQDIWTVIQSKQQ